MRFDVTQMKFVWSLGAEEEDKKLEKTENETSNKRMARLCGPAINSINPDLVFTSEIPEVFKKECALPMSS